MAAQPIPDQTPDPNEKLVKVFDTEVESEAMIVKGLLDSAGIDNDLKSGTWVQDTFPGLGGMVILVREEDADKARKTITESQQISVAEVTADAEAQSDDDPTEELPTAR